MFLVFAGQEDGLGGWKDFIESFNNEELAISYANRLLSQYDWSHVVELETGKIIWMY